MPTCLSVLLPSRTHRPMVRTTIRTASSRGREFPNPFSGPPAREQDRIIFIPSFFFSCAQYPPSSSNHPAPSSPYYSNPRGRGVRRSSINQSSLPAPGLRLLLLPLRAPRFDPLPLPPPPPGRPLFAALPGGGRTKAKSTLTVWPSRSVLLAPSIAARASSSVVYSINA